MERHRNFYTRVGELRTDESFRNRTDAAFHPKPYNLPSTLRMEQSRFNMIDQFPLDAMHLLDLGSAKLILEAILDMTLQGDLNKGKVDLLKKL